MILITWSERNLDQNGVSQSRSENNFETLKGSSTTNKDGIGQSDIHSRWRRSVKKWEVKYKLEVPTFKFIKSW